MCYIISLTLIIGGYILWVVGSEMERIGDEMIRRSNSEENESNLH